MVTEQTYYYQPLKIAPSARPGPVSAVCQDNHRNVKCICYITAGGRCRHKKSRTVQVVAELSGCLELALAGQTGMVFRSGEI